MLTQTALIAIRAVTFVGMDDLFVTTANALAAAAPTSQTDAMLLVARKTAEALNHDALFCEATKALSFDNEGYSYHYFIEDEALKLVVTEGFGDDLMTIRNTTFHTVDAVEADMLRSYDGERI